MIVWKMIGSVMESDCHSHGCCKRDCHGSGCCKNDFVKSVRSGPTYEGVRKKATKKCESGITTFIILEMGKAKFFILKVGNLAHGGIP